MRFKYLIELNKVYFFWGLYLVFILDIAVGAVEGKSLASKGEVFQCFYCILCLFFVSEV